MPPPPGRSKPQQPAVKARRPPIPDTDAPMPWIRQIDEPDAEGPYAELLAEVRASGRQPSFFLRALSLRPGAARGLMEMQEEILLAEDSELDFEERLVVALVLSTSNRSGASTARFRHILLQAWGEAELVDQVAVNFRAVPDLPPRLAALLEYADKVNRSPNLAMESDIAALRAAGVGDKGILELVLLAAFVGMVNRVELGIGVEINPAEAGLAPPLEHPGEPPRRPGEK